MGHLGSRRIAHLHLHLHLALASPGRFFGDGVAVNKIIVDFLYYMNYNSYYERY